MAKKGINYGYDLELCTSFRDHMELKPYDFDNKTLTLSGQSKDIKYLIDHLSKYYKIDVDGFEDLPIVKMDPFENWLNSGMEAHKYTQYTDMWVSPELKDVKIHFDYDFNDELMEKIRTYPIDCMDWICDPKYNKDLVGV